MHMAAFVKGFRTVPGIVIHIDREAQPLEKIAFRGTPPFAPLRVGGTDEGVRPYIEKRAFWLALVQRQGRIDIVYT